MRWWPALLSTVLASVASAGELPKFSEVAIDGVIHTAVGVTRRGTPIDLFVSAEDRADDHAKARVVLIGGADGDRRSVDAALEALRWFYTESSAAEYRKRFTLAVIPCANPDGVLLDKGVENGQGGRFGDYAAKDKLYASPTNVEGQYIDGWLRQHGGLIAWHLVVDGGTVASATQLIVEDGKGSKPLMNALDRLGDLQKQPHPQRQLHLERLKQDDKEFVRQLLENYRHAPKSKSYFDTLPLKANQRLQVHDLRVGVMDFEWGAELPKSASELSGLLYLLEGDASALAEAQLNLLRRSADLALESDGTPRKSPPFYSQMSDAVFMNGPLLTGVGRLTKEGKYFEACAAHQAVVRRDCQRDDGLFRHSPLCEAAWGRGNGFVALGNTLMLEDWPETHPERAVLLQVYRQHMAALLRHQDYTGMWHQVIDHPESYREFTCTCMIAFAMARGVRAGWLDKSEYQSAIERAWRAVKVRTNDKGDFIDVCTGTGKQNTLRDYYDREALRGRDGRGASMLLMLATEVLRSR